MTFTIHEKKTVAQWVHDVVGFSSEYGPSSWSAKSVMGPPRFYPNAGDSQLTWAPSQNNTVEFIELEFEKAVIPKELNIYETYSPGAIVKVSTKENINDTWNTVWEGAQDLTACSAKRARIMNVQLSPEGGHVKYVRLDLDNTPTWDDWSEIDAVELVGTHIVVQEPSPLQNAFLECLEEGTFCDLEITCQGVVFKVHRGILSHRSAVIRSLLNSGMQESKEQRIEIHDVAPAIFKKMLQFWYSGLVTAEEDELFLLASCANFYCVTELVQWCEERLLHILNVENAVSYLEQCTELHLATMEGMVLAYCARHFKEFFMSGALDKVSEVHLRKICALVGKKA